ncbi:hypothetical protein GOP47_0019210 [Adiantum capillus-veneris]|uniref:Pentatricopeptide repeat-containing protein n=1 Tax=Adiantum capillus-veneris TaxID=13818 RepID=A0A9D4UG03_ADICA|nr:hypothetical protein GOP47_0019210 [Adiantum capillus-veneris]
MQRFVHSARLLSLCRCPYAHLSSSGSWFKGQVFAIEACGFTSISRGNENRKPRCNESSKAKRPLNPPARRRPRVSVWKFVKRTEAIERILQLLNAISGWDDAQTPLAISTLRVPLNRYTVSEVIRLCPCAEIALHFLQWLVKEEDFDADGYVYSSIIFRLGKAGKFEEMEEVAVVAIRDGKVSAITFTTLISAYRRANDLDGAVRTWQSMLKHNIQPSSAAYTVMIDMYGRMKMYEEAGDCYYQLVHSSVGPTIKTCSVLIYHLVEAGKQDAALDIFNNLKKVKLRPNRVTFAYLMLGYAKAGDVNSVLKLIEDFKEYGHSPYDLGESFRSTLSYLVKEGRVDDAIKAMQTGWPDASIRKIKAKIAELKRESLEDVSSSDASLQVDTDEEELEYDGVNLMVLHSRDQDGKSILNVLAFVRCLTVWSSGAEKSLDRLNVNWDCRLVSEVLARIKRVDSAWMFYKWVARKSGYRHDRYTCGKMVRMLLRARQFTCARHLLNEAENNNLKLPVKSYLNLLKHCGPANQASLATEVFQKLKVSGLVLDEAFYKSYIHTLHNCGQHWRVASACAEMKKAGFSLDKTMHSLLVTSFIRAGKLDIAKKLSKQMRAAGFCPDVDMLSYLFRVFHERGKLEKAEKVFKGMQQCGMKPAFHICEAMTQILSTLGRIEEADMLKGEIQTSCSRGARVKIHRREWLLYYHSVFVNSFKDDSKVEVMMAAG